MGGAAAGLGALGLCAAAALGLARSEGPRLTPEPIGGRAGAAGAVGAAAAGGAGVPGYVRAGAAGDGVTKRRPDLPPGKMALARKGGGGEGGSCGGSGPSSPAAYPAPPRAASMVAGAAGAAAAPGAVGAPAGGGGCGMMDAAAGGGGAGCGGGGGSCGCGGAGAGAGGAGEAGCGCGGAGATGGGSCGCGGGGDVTAAAPRGKGPHEDHTAHHGGLVGMKGDVHLELVRTAVHEWRLYLSDAVRNPIVATGGKAELEFFGDAGPLGRLAMNVSLDGKFFAGRMAPPAGATAVTIRVGQPSAGVAPLSMDMTFPAVVARPTADGTI
jgi:hypothetical protein